MKIWYSPYTIFLKGSANRATGSQLEGFLIKLQTADFACGYSDCLPWKIFGDESVPKLLARLKEGRLTELLLRSLFFATLDGEARAKKISLFESHINIKSHYTCTSLQELSPYFLESLSERGFDTIKVKMGIHPQQESKFFSKLSRDLIRIFQWRLDFNCLGGDQFLSLCSDTFLEQIDFVEDPIPYNAKKWQKLEAQTGVRLAWDQPASHEPYTVYKGIRVIKPARESHAPRKKDILTNSLDHPVGQSFAFWYAQEHVQNYQKQPTDYGLKTNHLVSGVTDFTKEIFDESPFFTFSDGYGIGFDHLLKRQKWIAL